jgi:hypothetical protein
MDFQQLLAKMVEIDRPATESQLADECGMPPAMGPAEPPMGGMQQQQPPAHPSMSVNLNAQGMDNIESLMKLMTKVNPDMINQPQGGMPPMPGMSPMPSLTGPGPSISGIGDLGNLDAGPLKMLPDLDKDRGPDMGSGNDKMPGGDMDSDYNDDGKLDRHEKDHADEKPLLKTLDLDKDGDHDMDDHDMEKKKDKEEAFGNSLDDSEPETKDMDAAIPSGNDLHKQKSMHRAAAGGDNPMKAESGDLRAQIRAELLQRLAEAKGAK